MNVNIYVRIKKGEDIMINKKNKNCNRSKQKGITLLVLVITIVILVILAGISINLLSGSNGIINKANKSKEDHEILIEKEQISDSYSGSKMHNNGDNPTAADLKTYMNDSYGENTVDVTGSANLIVKYIASSREYIIEQDGTIKYLENATEPPSGQKNTKNIGIAEDGTSVNLDLWTYTLIDNAYYRLSGDDTGCGLYSYGYSNSHIVNGKIVGSVPAYIKGPEGKFLPVTSMSGTFEECTSLTVAPVIPSGVTDMVYTFFNCTSLTTAPEIPSGVTDMRIYILWM